MPKKKRTMPINKNKTSRKAPARGALPAPNPMPMPDMMAAMAGAGSPMANSADVALANLQKKRK